MALVLTLPSGFPEAHIPKARDVVQLAADGDWDTLAQVPVCIDSYGKVVAHFGDTTWDCSPFSAGKGIDISQREFNFTYLADSPNLLLQTKLIAYGWLYHIGHKSGRRCKLSTLAGRFNIPLKRALSSILNQQQDDLCALHDGNVWSQLESDLEAAKLSQVSIELTFTALSAIARLDNWLPFRFALPEVNFKELACKLAAEGKTEKQQTLAIPQALADILYGEAVRLVEKAWPHRETLAQLERDLQANYNAGRSEIDRKIASGKWTFLHDADGQLIKKKYIEEINKATPLAQTKIIYAALKDTELLPEGPANGSWLVTWRNKLQSSCFICCGAFSGMRVSELFELHTGSFYTHEIDDQTFHAVRATTHKLTAGKKHEEWLCSPVVEKAVGLATALSASQREQMLQIAQHTRDPAQSEMLRESANCLWLSQQNRSNQPIVIARTRWNTRLRLYARQIGALVDNATLAECRLLNPQDNGAIEIKVKIGEPWPFTTHQFRRTFACFAVRNHLGHPIAIKQQFKHLYLRMAEWYGNGAVEARLQDVQVDSELTDLLNQAGIEHTTDKYYRWHHGDEKLSGVHGKSIVAMRDDKPVIYSSWDKLYRLVKEGRLTLHGTLHSYCKNGYDCDMDGVINPAFCVDCSGGGSVIDAEQALWWQRRHSALTAYLSEQANVSRGEYAHCITQIRAAEQVMRDHQLNHETYQHPVEVINL